MSIGAWCLTYFVFCSIYAWIIRWGGAEKLEGWLGWLFTGWNESHEIRLYAKVMWAIFTILFFFGLFFPGLRIEWWHV